MKKMLLVLAFCTLYALFMSGIAHAAPLQSQSVAWLQTAGPYGGMVKAVVIDPTLPQTIYAGTGGGVFTALDVTTASYTVTFNSNGGSGTMNPQSNTMPTSLAANTFIRTGYAFTGWNSAANGSGTTYANGVMYSFDADLTLYAQWKVPKPLPGTGQTKCYQAVSPYAEIPCAGTGQDGAYNSNPLSYTDNGNGTVTDNNTGLMWQKCSVGQSNNSTCSGTATTYTWFRASGTYDASYNSLSQSVCGDLRVGSYSGWRLPTKKELMSIVDYSIPDPGPTIVGAYFPNTVSSYYWSSTTAADYPNGAWDVYFPNGYVVYYGKDGHYYVRCVRGGQ